jgi:hypothetical protein
MGGSFLDASDYDPPAGVPEEVSDTYSRLILPVLLSQSFLSQLPWEREHTEAICSYTEHLDTACRTAQEFLSRNETRLRVVAPAVFALGKEILNSTGRLLHALLTYRHSFSPQFIEFTKGKLEEMPQSMVNQFRESSFRALEQIPIPPLRSLVDRLRDAASVWATSFNQPPTANGPFDPFGFRFGEKTMDLSHAPLRFKLLEALWDKAKGKPYDSRTVTTVLEELYPDDDAADANLKNVGRKLTEEFSRAEVPLEVKQAGGKIWLILSEQDVPSSFNISP